MHRFVHYFILLASFLVFVEGKALAKEDNDEEETGKEPEKTAGKAL